MANQMSLYSAFLFMDTVAKRPLGADVLSLNQYNLTEIADFVLLMYDLGEHNETVYDKDGLIAAVLKVASVRLATARIQAHSEGGRDA